MRFRGPNGQGISHVTTIPTSLSNEQERWKVELDGNGHSSPVIHGDKVFYTITTNTTPPQRRVVCRSLSNGKELWAKGMPFNSYKTHKFNSFSSTSPAVDAQRVYVWWNDGDQSEVFALDHAGKRVWRKKLGAFKSQHGSGSSLALSDGVLLVQKENLSEDTFVAGLNPATGKQIWKRPLPETSKTSYVTPAIRTTPQGLEALFISMTHGVFGVNVKTGEETFRYETGFRHRSVASPILVDGEFLFASCGNGAGDRQSLLLQLPNGDAAAKASHQLTKQLPYVPTGIGKDGLLFLVNDGGIGTCTDVKTGEMLWRERLVRKCFASPVCINGNIYVLGRDGDYHVFAAERAFRSVSKGEIEGAIDATPALGGGCLFIRTDSHLICFGAGSEA